MESAEQIPFLGVLRAFWAGQTCFVERVGGESAVSILPVCVFAPSTLALGHETAAQSRLEGVL